MSKYLVEIRIEDNHGCDAFQRIEDSASKVTDQLLSLWVEGAEYREGERRRRFWHQPYIVNRYWHPRLWGQEGVKVFGPDLPLVMFVPTGVFVWGDR